MKNIPNLEQIKSYFNQRVGDFGASPLGADWNSEASQFIRFDQLLKVVEIPTFSLLDYGCGYGALADYMEKKGFNVKYYGFDILKSAIELANRLNSGKPERRFFFNEEDLCEVDYTVASGIFNMRGDLSFKEWTDYVITILQQFDRLSQRGFSCNFLTKYSDQERMRSDLYYADPSFLFDYCKRNICKNVAILHDYDLYDFTLIVRKD